jgi:hypothetical protein
MDEKITLNLKVDRDSFLFDGVLIKCDSYISLENKLTLLYDYAKTIYDSLTGVVFEGKDIVDAHITAEYTMILGIVQLCTNISIEGENAVDVNKLIGSGLWDNIRNRIVNYEEFRNDVEKVKSLVVEKIKYDNSTNEKLNIIFDKISMFLDNFSKFDMKEFTEKINEFQEELKKLNETVPGITSDKVTPKRKSKKESNLN